MLFSISNLMNRHICPRQNWLELMFLAWLYVWNFSPGNKFFSCLKL